jgi:trigger factor
MSDENTTPAAENEQNFADFTVKVEDAGTLKKKITVTVPRDRIDAKFDEMYGELGSSAAIPGFRVGRAPRRLIEKRFGEDVANDVRNSLIGEGLGAADEQTDIQTLGEPDLDLEAVVLPDTGDMDFSFEVEVAPEFDLPELKGIAVDKPQLEVTDEQVDDYLERFRTSRAKFEASEGPTAEGDMVTADVVLKADGCDDVERTDVPVRVGPGQIEGLPLVTLGEDLAGKKVGDVVSLSAAAGEGHPHEPWHGKDVAIELTIKEITARILPDVDDTFASDMGFDNLEEMKTFVRSQLEGQLDMEAMRMTREQVCNYLMDSTEFDLPEGVVARHTQMALQRRAVSLLQRGVPREQIDENLTQLQAEAETQAKQELKLSFIIGKIADDMEMEATEDEVNARLSQMAMQYGRRPERLRQDMAADGTLEHIHTAIREEKTVDKLLEDATVTELSAEEFKAKHAPDDADGDKPEKKAAKKATKKSAKKTAKKAEGDTKKKAAKKTTKKAAKKADNKDKDE